MIEDVDLLYVCATKLSDHFRPGSGEFRCTTFACVRVLQYGKLSRDSQKKGKKETKRGNDLERYFIEHCGRRPSEAGKVKVPRCAYFSFFSLFFRNPLVTELNRIRIRY